PMNALPEVSVSSPAMQWRSVDFPDPEGPMIALNRAASNATLTPSSARTSVDRLPYTFVASTVAAAAETGNFSAVERSIVAIPTLPVTHSHVRESVCILPRGAVAVQGQVSYR